MPLLCFSTLVVSPFHEAVRAMSLGHMICPSFFLFCFVSLPSEGAGLVNA